MVLLFSWGVDKVRQMCDCGCSIVQVLNHVQQRRREDNADKRVVKSYCSDNVRSGCDIGAYE